MPDAKGDSRILVVDDSATQAEELRFILEAQGYAVEVAHDGVDGLARLKQRKFALVLSDVLMPRLNGYELCHQVRADPATREIPVILLTALKDPTDIIQGLECGASNFITKPCEAAYLVDRVSAILAKKSPPAQRPASARLELSLQGKSFTITSEREQILDMLIATYEELRRAQQREYEIRLNEEALRQSHHMLQSALNVLPAYIAVLDDQGTVLLANDAWRRFTDQTAFFGGHFSIGAGYLTRCAALEKEYHCSGPSALLEGLRAVVAGQREQFEMEYAHGGGYFSVRAMRYREEQADRVILRYADITDHKKADEVQARLIHAQAAQAEAENANRIKDEFLAIVSHELRTPLTAILGWANLLRSGRLDAANSARAVEIIERNSRAQAQLVEDLLDVSRIITGKLRISAEPLELRNVVENSVDVVRLAAQAKNIRLEVELSGTPAMVLGDAGRLRQVVWNLLSNAIKFTPRGGQVTVRMEVSEQAACVVICDTGKGITADFLPHVFERFRQADSSSARGYGGLGLGLAIVRHLVELHGGSVRVESAGDNQGATFTVELPLLSVDERPFGWRPGQGAAKPPVENQLGGIKVLVVDDDNDSREYLANVLSGCGAQVTNADSAAAALAAFQKDPPALVLSDIAMPGEDGFSLLRRMRAWEDAQARQHVPVMALTAFAGPEYGRRLLEAGFEKHLPKPIDPVMLVNAVAGAVGRKMTP